MKFNHIATLSLLAGSAFSHVHASKEVMQTDEDGGKVGVGTNANIEAEHHVQRRAKAKGKKSSKSNTEKSDDDEMVAMPLTIRLENVSDNVDMDMMRSALKDLVESTAKDWAECNTDGGRDYIKLELMESDEDSDMFQRKLGTYQNVWELTHSCRQTVMTVIEALQCFFKLLEFLQNHAKLWEALMCAYQRGSDCVNIIIAPACYTLTDETSCGGQSGSCWWSTQDNLCYETCYNTEYMCGNQVPRYDNGMCQYWGSGFLCASSDCVGNGSNYPGVDPC